eukprot:61901-Prorocentrum_minimum.AAC.1
MTCSRPWQQKAVAPSGMMSSGNAWLSWYSPYPLALAALMASWYDCVERPMRSGSRVILTSSAERPGSFFTIWYSSSAAGGSDASTGTEMGAGGCNFPTVTSRMPSAHTAFTESKSASSARRTVRCSIVSRPPVLLFASTLSRPSSVTLRLMPSAATPGTAAISLYAVSFSTNRSLGSYISR